MQCEIVLDNPKANYFSGQVIHCIVRLHVAKDINIEGIRIDFLGEGKVELSKESYSATTNYACDKLRVRGYGVLPQGSYVYMFTKTLPPDSPSSCKAKYGFIRYGISVVVERGLFRFNNVFKKPLTVCQTVDLNIYRHLRIPILAENFKRPSCWSCSGKKLHYFLYIPFGAYIPGEVIEYKLVIKNDTTTDTKGYTFELVQIQTFRVYAKSPKRHQRTCVIFHQRYSDPCMRLSNRQIDGQFKIPSLTPSAIYAGSIIMAEYMLKVTVHLPGINCKTELKIPIFIGTHPIRYTPLVQAIATAPDACHVTEEMPPRYEDLLTM